MDAPGLVIPILAHGAAMPGLLQLAPEYNLATPLGGDELLARNSKGVGWGLEPGNKKETGIWDDGGDAVLPDCETAGEPSETEVGAWEG